MGEAPLTPAERTRIRELEAAPPPQHGERVPEKSECVLREPEPVKFSFIGQVAEEQRQLPPGVRFPVVFMCRMLEVTRQGYTGGRSGRSRRMIRRTLSWPRGSGTCIRKGIRTGWHRADLWDCRRRGTSPPSGGAPPGAGRGPAGVTRAVGADDRAGQQGNRRPGRSGGPPVHRPGAGPAVGRRYHLYLDVSGSRPGDAYRHVLE